MKQDATLNFFSAYLNLRFYVENWLCQTLCDTKAFTKTLLPPNNFLIDINYIFAFKERVVSIEFRIIFLRDHYVHSWKLEQHTFTHISISHFQKLFCSFDRCLKYVSIIFTFCICGIGFTFWGNSIFSLHNILIKDA